MGAPQLDPDHRQPRLGLFGMLFLCLGGVSLIPTLVLSAYQAPRLAADTRASHDQELTLAAEAVAREVELEVQGHVRALESLAGSVEMPGPPGELVLQLSQLQTRYGGFSFMAATLLDGKSIASAPPQGVDGKPSLGTDYSDRAYFKEVMRTGRTVVGGVLLGKRSGVPNTHIGVPVLGKAGAVTGCLIGSLDLGVVKRVTQRVLDTASNTRVVVLDAGGHVLAHPSSEAERSMKVLSGVPLYGAGAALDLRTAQDEHGVLQRAAMVPLDLRGSTWTVVAMRPQATIDTQVARAWQQTGLAGLLTLLAGLLVSAVLAAWLALPIRQLAQVLADMGPRRSMVPPRARPRETREVASLLSAVSQMMKRMDAHTSELENTVAERTTQLRAANAELERNLAALRDAQAHLGLADRMASVGSLAAGVAHEVNNPLAYVMGNITFAVAELEGVLAAGDLALSGSVLEECTKALKDAEDGAQRVKAIVSDLKMFSRGAQDTVGPVDVRQTLEAAINMARHELRHRARLKTDCQDVPPVTANEPRLLQVFLNLIVNAAQSIQEGALDRNQVLVASRLEGGRVVVEISDTGCGIPTENLPRIFDPFFTTKGVGEGTGLGLAICHRIVSGMGGAITVTSTVGKGSSFCVSLPPAADTEVLQPVPAPAPAARPAPEPPPLSAARARILVVDDEPSVANALRRLLASTHDVVTLTSAQEALQRIRGGDVFDVILCDVMMPQLDGVEFSEALTASNPAQALNLVFTTGGAFTPRARAFLSQSGRRVLEKPFEAEEVRHVVAQVLLDARARSSVPS